MTQMIQELGKLSSSDEVPEITPLDQFDVFKSKVNASIYWLIYKAYPYSEIPEEFNNLFYTDSQGEAHLKPLVINQLVSAELYCKACSNIFRNTEYQWQGHWSVIQILSRNGIYVVDKNEEAVTEGMLVQASPFKLNAHLTLIDCIMSAYIIEVVTVEKIVQSVRRFTTFNASSELPFDAEDALLFWLNKVSMTVKHRLEKELKAFQQKLMQLDPSQAQRMVPPSVPTLPTMDDLLKDICDGCCLAVILHFYAPKLLNITDISIHQNMSFADSIYNLQVIKSFCTEYIPGLFALSCEDLLYTPPLLKTNIIVMLAELFWWLETERPDWVQPQGMKIERIQDKPEAQRPPSGSRIGFTRSRPLPISSVTKRSFQPPVSPSQLKSSNSNPEINKAVSSSQPLLSRRHRLQQRHSIQMDEQQFKNLLPRSSSLENVNVKNSTIAWPEVNQSGIVINSGKAEKENNGVHESIKSEDSGGDTQSLLANVSIDSNLDDDDVAIDLELQSVTSSIASVKASHKLVPATMKPRKEIIQLTNKEEERGEVKNKNGDRTYREGFSSTDTSPDSIPDSIAGDLVHTKTKHGEAFFIDTSPTDEVPSVASSYAPSVAGSYVISDKHMTAEGAVAAGIPIVQDENAQPHTQRRLPEKPHGNPHHRQAGRDILSDTVTNSLTPDRELHKLHTDQTDREDAKKQFLVQFGQAMQRQERDVVTDVSKPPHIACSGMASDFNSAMTTDNRKTRDTNVALSAYHPDNVTQNHQLTNWVEHTHQHHNHTNNLDSETQNAPVTSELMQIRMKLDEKRRAIEYDKKHMERQRTKQRQRMGKAAFLQVVGKKDGTTESDNRGKMAPRPQVQPAQDESYNTSLEKINANLSQLQTELLRLSQQQEQMKVSQQQEHVKVGSSPREQQSRESNQTWINTPRSETETQSGFFLQSSPNTNRNWQQGDYSFSTSPAPKPVPAFAPSAGMTSSNYQQSPSVTPSKYQPALNVLPSKFQPISNPNVTPVRYPTTSSSSNARIPGFGGSMTSSPAPSISPSFNTPTAFQFTPYTNQTSSPVPFTLEDQSVSYQQGTPPPQQQQQQHTVQMTTNKQQVISQPQAIAQMQSKTIVKTSKQIGQQSRPGEPPQPFLSPQISSHQQSPQTYSPIETSLEELENRTFTPPQQLSPKSEISPSTQPRQPSPMQVTKQQSPPSQVTRQPSSPSQVTRQPSPPSQVTRQPSPPSQVTRQPSPPPQIIKQVSPPAKVVKAPLPVTVTSSPPTEITSPHQVQQELLNNTVAISQPILPDEKQVTKTQLIKVDNEDINNIDDDKLKGFIVGEAKSDDINAAKKREHFLKNRLKRQEEERAKKALREVEEEKRREAQRIKQEQIEKKKEEERQRREHIKQEYLRKKQEQETEPVEKERKTPKTARARPKSRVFSHSMEDHLDSKSLSIPSQGKTVTVGKSGIPKKLETSLPQPSTPPQLPQVAPSSSSSSSSTITAITCGDQAENVNVFAEYSGPKLFVKPATKSNRHLITNAITHCVLAGHVNKDMKDRVLQEIAKADAHHFLILFRNSGLQFRSLYSYLPESEEIIKIYGTGPRQVSSDMVEKIFKYNSGGKHFVAIPSKTMSVSVDAFVIYNHLWQHKKTGVAKRPQHPH